MTASAATLPCANQRQSDQQLFVTALLFQGLNAASVSSKPPTPHGNMVPTSGGGNAAVLAICAVMVIVMSNSGGKTSEGPPGVIVVNEERLNENRSLCANIGVLAIEIGLEKLKVDPSRSLTDRYPQLKLPEQDISLIAKSDKNFLDVLGKELYFKGKTLRTFFCPGSILGDDLNPEPYAEHCQNLFGPNCDAELACYYRICKDGYIKLNFSRLSLIVPLKKKTLD